jgi:hypothetical protein
MKQALIIVIALIGLVGVLFFSFRNERAVATSAAQQWSGEMGNLKTVAVRWPREEANDASVKLTSLADTLPNNDQALDDYVAREIKRDELTINEPPALPDVTSVRELLLRETVVWERHDEVGDEQAIAARTIQMTMARALVADALARARTNDPKAWDDLQAVWKLSRSLNSHPQMMAQTAALSMARMINAVAWKMPLPAPAWFDELQTHDNIRVLLDSFQHQTASYWKSGARWFPTTWLASSIDNDRKISEDLFNFTGCDADPPMNQLGTDLTSLWRRAFRYRAEREATANALRVREGKSIETSSRCSDGAWTFDGSTLRFNHEIATAPPDNPMPLILKIKH